MITEKIYSRLTLRMVRTWSSKRKVWRVDWEIVTAKID